MYLPKPLLFTVLEVKGKNPYMNKAEWKCKTVELHTDAHGDTFIYVDGEPRVGVFHPTVKFSIQDHTMSLGGFVPAGIREPYYYTEFVLEAQNNG